MSCWFRVSSCTEKGSPAQTPEGVGAGLLVIRTLTLGTIHRKARVTLLDATPNHSATGPVFHKSEKEGAGSESPRVRSRMGRPGPHAALLLLPQSLGDTRGTPGHPTASARAAQLAEGSRGRIQGDQRSPGPATYSARDNSKILVAKDFGTRILQFCFKTPFSVL